MIRTSGLLRRHHHHYHHEHHHHPHHHHHHHHHHNHRLNNIHPLHYYHRRRPAPHCRSWLVCRVPELPDVGAAVPVQAHPRCGVPEHVATHHTLLHRLLPQHVRAIDSQHHWREMPQVSFLSRQTRVCHDKRRVLSRQKYVCRYTTFVVTKSCLSGQNLCRDRYTFVATKKKRRVLCRLLCRQT